MYDRHPPTQPTCQTNAPHSRGRNHGLHWPKLLSWLPVRLRVFFLGVFLVISGALATSVLIVMKTGATEAISLWWLIAIGPFAGLYEGQMFSLRTIGIMVGILAPLMLAHPIAPHWSTAIVSLLGFAMWGFMGLAICTSSV